MGRRGQFNKAEDRRIMSEFADIESRVFAQKMFRSQREHPLQYNSQFRFVEYVKQFGNVPLYNVATKVTSEILRKKQRIPHTDVYYGNLVEATGHGAPEVVGIVWVRRMPREQIELAVATLLMMGKEVVILRAFSP